MGERLFVVGAGAATCLGKDLESTWQGLIAGQSGIRRHAALNAESFLIDIAGMVEGLEGDPIWADRTLLKLGARFLPLSMKAAQEAWADAGLNATASLLDPHRVAVVVGSAFGGLDFLEAQQARMRRRHDLSISPFLAPGLLINQAAGQISQQLGLYGPSVAPSNACATGGHAIIMGAMFLTAGQADVALCGASESAFMPAVVNGFSTMKALFARKQGDRAQIDPGQASRPFSVDRAGFVMSEGSGMLVLATETAVRRMSLTPRAELRGYAVNTDGYHMAMPNEERITRCVERALAHSGLSADSIDYYNAHGTSTSLNDLVETRVLKAVFGGRAAGPPVSSIKGALGHGLGAAAAIEAAVCVRAIRDQIIPPTINFLPDPELDLDYVPNEARSARLGTVMSASFGFGGTNNVLILSEPSL